jgi:hypothetical protein
MIIATRFSAKPLFVANSWRLAKAIAPLAAVTAKFATDRCLINTQILRDLALRETPFSVRKAGISGRGSRGGSF